MKKSSVNMAIKALLTDRKLATPPEEWDAPSVILKELEYAATVNTDLLYFPEYRTLVPAEQYTPEQIAAMDNVREQMKEFSRKYPFQPIARTGPPMSAADLLVWMWSDTNPITPGPAELQVKILKKRNPSS